MPAWWVRAAKIVAETRGGVRNQWKIVNQQKTPIYLPSRCSRRQSPAASPSMPSCRSLWTRRRHRRAFPALRRSRTCTSSCRRLCHRRPDSGRPAPSTRAITFCLTSLVDARLSRAQSVAAQKREEKKEEKSPISGASRAPEACFRNKDGKLLVSFHASLDTNERFIRGFTAIEMKDGWSCRRDSFKLERQLCSSQASLPA